MVNLFHSKCLKCCSWLYAIKSVLIFREHTDRGWSVPNWALQVFQYLSSLGSSWSIFLIVILVFFLLPFSAFQICQKRQVFSHRKYNNLSLMLCVLSEIFFSWPVCSLGYPWYYLESSPIEFESINILSILHLQSWTSASIECDMENQCLLNLNLCKYIHIMASEYLSIATLTSASLQNNSWYWFHYCLYILIKEVMTSVRSLSVLRVVGLCGH